MVPDFFKFSIPTKVIYGEGISNRLSEELEYLGPKKVLLVTDKVMGTTGLVDRIRAGLASGPVQIVCVYDDVPPNSELKCVTDAAELGKSHNVDCIMALGGGSVMDTAKVANILISKGGKVQDHMGAQLITDKLLPSIFIPTT
ncbi:MAG: iron-containing alcohol dehydrogenase, partial [Leptospiraceae bacterium]|nr:iron-containing alcohol dehydrogenase [Leptospiraceae bacterium]